MESKYILDKLEPIMHNSIYTERVQGKVNKIIKDSCIGKDWLARGNANCIGDDPKATRFAKLINFFPPAYCLGYSGLTRRSHKSFFALIHTSTHWPWYFTCRHDNGKIRLIAPILDLHSAPYHCVLYAVSIQLLRLPGHFSFICNCILAFESIYRQ